MFSDELVRNLAPWKTEKLSKFLFYLVWIVSSWVSPESMCAMFRALSGSVFCLRDNISKPVRGSCISNFQFLLLFWKSSANVLWNFHLFSLLILFMVVSCGFFLQSLLRPGFPLSGPLSRWLVWFPVRVFFNKCCKNKASDTCQNFLLTCTWADGCYSTS